MLKSKRWLEDYALFMALKDAHGGESWTVWQDDVARRGPLAMRMRSFARGLLTYGLRMARHNARAWAVARLLESHPAVGKVHHLGLEWHPQRAGESVGCEGADDIIADLAQAPA
ncbi:MAG: hypothetical protein KatS3mg052_1973 [Candidatus Roseilinea sp.]|nr:MAG: hypothetical protein KatS3mg052_1973 [Candidatus Roseilinea sp.]